MPDTTDIITDDFMTGFDDDFIADTEDEITEETVEEEVESTEDETETETVETEAETEETTEVPEEVSTDPETIDYSYNHQTTALPFASVKAVAEKLGMSAQEVVTILQKGSNYDVLNGRQEPYRTAIDRIDRFASANGYSKEDAIKRAVEALDVIESAKHIEELKKQYPDAPAKVLQDMAMMKVRNVEPKEVTAEENKAEADREKMWVGFFKNHPEVKADNLSPRMLQALENNENPEYVFMSERKTEIENKNKELEQKLKEMMEKQNKAARSTGTSKRTSGNTKSDAFLDAFFN